MKKYLIVYYGDTPECVEKFPKDCKRSVKGALHVYPGRQMTVTESEYKHIQNKYPHMKPKLRVLSEMEEAKPVAKKEAKEEVKTEPKVEKAAVEEAEPKKTQKGKKKK